MTNPGNSTKTGSSSDEIAPNPGYGVICEPNRVKVLRAIRRGVPTTLAKPRTADEKKKYIREFEKDAKNLQSLAEWEITEPYVDHEAFLLNPRTLYHCTCQLWIRAFESCSKKDKLEHTILFLSPASFARTERSPNGTKKRLCPYVEARYTQVDVKEGQRIIPCYDLIGTGLLPSKQWYSQQLHKLERRSENDSSIKFRALSYPIGWVPKIQVYNSVQISFPCVLCEVEHCRFRYKSQGRSPAPEKTKKQSKSTAQENPQVTGQVGGSFDAEFDIDPNTHFWKPASSHYRSRDFAYLGGVHDMTTLHTPKYHVSGPFKGKWEEPQRYGDEVPDFGYPLSNLAKVTKPHIRNLIVAGQDILCTESSHIEVPDVTGEDWSQYWPTLAIHLKTEGSEHR